MRLISSIASAIRFKRRRFAASKRGSAAVEFALVAFPFFLIVMSIIEIGLISLSSATMKNGVREAGRLARVGASSCFTQAEVATVICDRSSFLPRCGERISLRQTVFQAGWQNDLFGAAEDEDEDFQTVDGGDVVVVQARYRWSVISPIVTPFLADDNGDFTFQQSFAFQAEAFDTPDCGPPPEDDAG